MYSNPIKYNRVNGRVFDKKSDEWEHVRKLSESRIVQTYNPIIYKYRSIDISAYVDNCKEMPERGKYIYINNFDRTLDIIKNNRIYAPRVEQLNDPFEGLYINFTVLGMMGDSIARGIGNRKRVLENMYKQRIISMSKSARIPQLWAYYAQNYTGVCLVFRTNNTFKDYRDIVYYRSDDNPYIAGINDMDIIREIGEINLFYKQIDWQSEQEVRIRCNSENEFLQFESQELIAVILGQNISHCMKNQIIEECEKMSKEVYIAKIDYYNSKIYIIPYGMDMTGDGRDMYDKWYDFREKNSEKVSLNIKGELIEDGII